MNHLYYGDNLETLRCLHLLKDSEIDRALEAMRDIFDRYRGAVAA